LATELLEIGISYATGVGDNFPIARFHNANAKPFPFPAHKVNHRIRKKVTVHINFHKRSPKSAQFDLLLLLYRRENPNLRTKRRLKAHKRRCAPDTITRAPCIIQSCKHKRPMVPGPLIRTISPAEMVGQFSGAGVIFWISPW